MKKILIGALVLTSVSAFAVDFDQISFEKNLDKALISTDVYFACSESGKVETEELIQSIKEKALNLPVANSAEVAAKLEANYRVIFDCKIAIRKALDAGLTDNEIQFAINRVEVKQNKSSDSSFDTERFEAELTKALSL